MIIFRDYFYNTLSLHYHAIIIITTAHACTHCYLSFISIIKISFFIKKSLTCMHKIFEDWWMPNIDIVDNTSLDNNPADQTKLIITYTNL